MNRGWNPLIVTLLVLLTAAGVVASSGAEPAAADRPQYAPVTLRTWQQTYHRLHQSGDLSWSGPDIVTLSRLANRRAGQGTIPVAILRTEPATVPATGDAQPPVFAVAALVDRTLRGERAEFVFDRNLHFCKADGALPKLEVQAGDDPDFRPVAFDRPFTVSFSRTGTEVVRVRAQYPDGTVRLGGFFLEVARLQTPSPDQTWGLIADIPYQGGLGTGVALVYLADEHSSLTNPVLLIEGFDLDNSMGWDELYEAMNQENLIEDLRSLGYDAVVLNFTDATDLIQRNAFVTVGLIQQINATISPQTSLVVVGASMGGLVGRFALAYMEAFGMNHNTRTFISFDSPQRGANIPLGLQRWVEFFATESADAALFRDALNSPAARQMLLYQYNALPPPAAGHDPLRDDLMAEFEILGGYPDNLRRVAIANGSGSGVDQGYLPGEQIVHYEYYSFLVDIVGNVWAVPDQTMQVVFHGVIDLIWPLPDTEQTVSVGGTLPLDSVPGGFSDSMAQVDSAAVPYGDVIALHPNHCFIPTISALDIDTEDYFYLIDSDPDILDLTPFHAIYFPEENQEHILITPESSPWIIAEIEGIGTPVEGLSAAALPTPVVYPNYPNPFNPVTTISYSLPRATTVTLGIFNLKGARLHSLLREEEKPRGMNYEIWNGCDDAGRPVPSGIYVYRLETGGAVVTRRLAVVR